MSPTSGRGIVYTLRIIGSLWFAAVILVSLLVAMACATVFESMHSSERALDAFYLSSWFTVLLVLLAVNVTAAVVVRYPFNRRQIGFILTHAGIVITLLGAWVTKEYGLNQGQLGVGEGETVSSFSVPIPILKLYDRETRTAKTIDLDKSIFNGFDRVADATVAPLDYQGARAEVRGYLPDSREVREVVNADAGGQMALEVSLSGMGHDHPVWVFAGGNARVGPLAATFRVTRTKAQLDKLLADPVESADEGGGVVKVEVDGALFSIPLEAGLAGVVPVGDTGYSIRVLRYLPHATVGSENKITNLSNRPVNPAIEVELTGPAGTETRLSFARFPDFSSMHGEEVAKAVKVTFIKAEDTSPQTPIEFVAGPDGELFVRLQPSGGPVAKHKVTIGQALATPWPGQELTVRKRYDHAQPVSRVEAVEPMRKKRAPAILVRLTSGEKSSDVWVRKYTPREVSLGKHTYDLVFMNKELPLGFSVTLNKFQVRYYPGTGRPRSFESTITITDPKTRRTRTEVVSMNSPVDHGKYTLFQSSYDLNGKIPVTFLSVADDPGMPIVFAGYIAIMVGMVVVLWIRMAEHSDQPVGGGLAAQPKRRKDTVAKRPVDAKAGTVASSGQTGLERKVKQSAPASR